MQRSQYSIGIDPGVNTGLAVYDRTNKKLAELASLPFWEAIAFLERWIADTRGNIEVTLENVEALAPTFRKKGDSAGKVREKISQNVGSVKRDCQLLKEWLTLNEVKTQLKVPGQTSITKMNADLFNKITRWQGKTNSHMRDAALLVWGS